MSQPRYQPFEHLLLLGILLVHFVGSSLMSFASLFVQRPERLTPGESKSKTSPGGELDSSIRTRLPVLDMC